SFRHCPSTPQPVGKAFGQSSLSLRNTPHNGGSRNCMRPRRHDPPAPRPIRDALSNGCPASVHRRQKKCPSPNEEWWISYYNLEYLQIFGYFPNLRKGSIAFKTLTILNAIVVQGHAPPVDLTARVWASIIDRKSTRLNS